MNTSSLIFSQMFEHESSTYTYLIADSETKEAAIIDPVIETVERDLNMIKDLGLKLLYILDTHVHADHITGADRLRAATGAKTAIFSGAQVANTDIPLSDGQLLPLGKHSIQAISTPGHTNTCMCFYVNNMVFTGDTLLIRGTGRTDFQSGSSEQLYDSVTTKLFTLPDSTLVYPGHDYKGLTASTIGLEKKLNPRLGQPRTRDEFKKIMSELKLAFPKKINEAVPANLKGGRIAST